MTGLQPHKQSVPLATSDYLQTLLLTMPLTTAQKLANQMFFEKVHATLKDGGVWCGSNGCLKKVGPMFMCTDLDTYKYLKETVPSKWLGAKVLLFIDTTSK